MNPALEASDEHRPISLRFRVAKRASQLLGIFLASLLYHAPAVAGVIVTKKGRVFIGRINAEEDLLENSIRMRWPYPNARAPEGLERGGTFEFERHQIRWYSSKADTLTLDYWRDHKDEYVEPGFDRPNEVEIAGASGLDAGVASILQKAALIRPQVLAKATEQGGGCEFKAPQHWIREDSGELCAYVARQEPVDGYCARIHVVTISRPAGSVNTRTEAFTELLSSVSQGANFKVLSPPKSVPLSADSTEVLLETETTKGDMNILCLRYLIFSRKTLTIISCYATAKDFKRRRSFFEDFRKALRPLSDEG